MDQGADDRQLVDAALGGDRDAVEQLLRAHYGSVLAVCRRMMGNDADASDAAQEALVSIARGLAARRFDGRSRFSTWAYRVTTNACLDELRRRRRRETVTESDLDVLAARHAGPGADTAVVARLDVDAALARLPSDFRAAVVLRDLCGLEYAEIADVLGIPAGTVRSRIARGRAGLAALLGNPDPDHDRPTSTP